MGRSVYVALRVAQERSLFPEEVSLNKLFPRVACASIVLVDAERLFAATHRAIPRVRLTKPSGADLSPVQVPLEHLAVKLAGAGGARAASVPAVHPRPYPLDDAPALKTLNGGGRDVSRTIAWIVTAALTAFVVVVKSTLGLRPTEG